MRYSKQCLPHDQKERFGGVQRLACCDSPSHSSWWSTNHEVALRCAHALELDTWTTAVVARQVCRKALEAEAWHKPLSNHCSVAKRNQPQPQPIPHPSSFIRERSPYPRPNKHHLGSKLGQLHRREIRCFNGFMFPKSPHIQER